MAMQTVYLNAIRDAGIAEVSHFGLVDETGTELTGGSYARIADTPVADGNGVWRPSTDLEFDVPSGVTVGGWRAYDASSGGNDLGGDDLTQESFAEAGKYNLLAASTGVTHSAA